MNRRVIAIGAAVLVLGIAAFVVFGQGGSDDSGDESALSTEDRGDSSVEADDSAGNEPWTATSPLVATNDSGEIVPPKSTTKKTTAPPPAPTNPASPTTPETPATPPGGLTPEEQAYLDETKKVVETNAGELSSVARAVTEALGDGDTDSLATLVAPDEGDPSGYASTLAEQYPPISTYELGGNVNVFSTGDTTLYFTYALVVWTDGGITSEHTIPIVLRFVDGQWRLSTLGDTNPDLDYVQSVTL